MTKLTEKQESLLNELLEEFKGNAEVVMGPDGLMNQLRKRVVEAMLDGEMTSHWAMHPMIRPVTAAAIPATATQRRRSRAKTANWHWRFPGTGTADSNPRFSGRASAVWTAWTRRLLPCTPGA